MNKMNNRHLILKRGNVFLSGKYTIPALHALLPPDPPWVQSGISLEYIIVSDTHVSRWPPEAIVEKKVTLLRSLFDRNLVFEYLNSTTLEFPLLRLTQLQNYSSQFSNFFQQAVLQLLSDFKLKRDWIKYFKKVMKTIGINNTTPKCSVLQFCVSSRVR